MLGSLTGAYTVRSAMEGKVQNQWFGTLPEKSEEGIYSATGIPKYAQWTRSDEGDDIITTLSPKFISSNIRCGASSGERIGQGKPCGFVPFGSDSEILLAENTRIDVKAGDKIKAGSSVIATLVH
jgi:phosphatidylserine decarboxylase